IGHLDAAAGVAGLIKTVLALQHKMIPPSLHFTQPNPNIDFPGSPFYVNAQLSEWKNGNGPRRAGVSSFGIGGTNAHLVLEEAPGVGAAHPSRPWQLVLLSARTATALEALTSNLAGHLKQHADINLADVAYTLKVGRRAFGHRRMLICPGADNESAIDMLESRRALTGLAENGGRAVEFMLPGQGAQHIDMARQLYETEPVLRRQVDLCSELLRPHLNLDIRTVLYPGGEGAESATRLINQTWITQPALFVIEYALVKLLESWGIRPSAMIGHSIGEYVAACVAGLFSLEDALSLIAIRAKLTQTLPAGAMISVAV